MVHLIRMVERFDFVQSMVHLNRNDRTIRFLQNMQLLISSNGAWFICFWILQSIPNGDMIENCEIKAPRNLPSIYRTRKNNEDEDKMEKRQQQQLRRSNESSNKSDFWGYDYIANIILYRKIRKWFNEKDWHEPYRIVHSPGRSSSSSSSSSHNEKWIGRRGEEKLWDTLLIA